MREERCKTRETDPKPKVEEDITREGDVGGLHKMRIERTHGEDRESYKYINTCIGFINQTLA